MSIRLSATPGQRPARPERIARPPKPRRTTTLVPAAARTPTHLSDTEADLAGAAIETFVVAVGGRKKLLQTLAIADGAEAADKVINCLLDPDYASWSLRRICTYAGITVADLFASYKKALFVQAHVDAAQRITSQLPPIVDDVMRRALPIARPCPRCNGSPTTPGTSKCPICQGAGTVLSEPDLDRQKLALELGRLTERKAGIVMQQNQVAATAVSSHGTGSLEQLQQAVGELLFNPQRRRDASPKVIDVEGTSGAPQADPQLDLPIPRDEPDPEDLPADDADEDAEDDAPLQT
jgi:hypothetical protein